jgi:hypothetical protein
VQAPAETGLSGSMSGVWKPKHGPASEVPTDERAGNRGRTQPTAPHLDPTQMESRYGSSADSTTYTHPVPHEGTRALTTGTIHTAYPSGLRMFSII